MVFSRQNKLFQMFDGDDPVSRIARNTGWLLGGKGVGAVLSIFYLGLLTRTLGPEGFGIFTLILTVGNAAAILCSFDSWQAMVKYGQRPLRTGDQSMLGRLFGAVIFIELIGAILGCLIVLGALLLLGPKIGITAELFAATLGFALVQLLSLASAPMGFLRLCDRFDAAAYADSLMPIVRLIGALLAWWLMPTVSGFVIAWAASSVISASGYWLLALREARGKIGPLKIFHPRKALRSFQGLVPFLFTTNLQQSVSGLAAQLPLLAIGAFVGLAEAGLFRLAAQLMNALSKLGTLLARSMFAEFSRSNAHIDEATGAAELRRTLKQTSKFGIISALAISLLAIALGYPAILLMSGQEYIGAYILVVWLGVASAVRFAGLNLEPALMATNLHGLSLKIRTGALFLLAATLAIMLPLYGALGAALAILLRDTIEMGTNGYFVWRKIGRNQAS